MSWIELSISFAYTHSHSLAASFIRFLFSHIIPSVTFYLPICLSFAKWSYSISALVFLWKLIKDLYMQTWCMCMQYLCVRVFASVCVFVDKWWYDIPFEWKIHWFGHQILDAPTNNITNATAAATIITTTASNAETDTQCYTLAVTSSHVSIFGPQK